MLMKLWNTFVNIHINCIQEVIYKKSIYRYGGNMYENISIAQARRDLLYIRKTYGNPQDFCGTFCNNDLLNSIMFGETPVKEAIIQNIEYYFSNGLESDLAGCSSQIYPDYTDKRIRKIIYRYAIPLSNDDHMKIYDSIVDEGYENGW